MLVYATLSKRQTVQVLALERYLGYLGSFLFASPRDTGIFQLCNISGLHLGDR